MLGGVRRIGFLGAYSIDNAGDVLVGLATRRAVAARVACEEVVLAPDLPEPHFRHDFGVERGGGAPIRRVAPGAATDWSDDLDALVIGGGGILSLDPAFDPVLRWGRPPAAWNAVGAQAAPWYVPALAERYAAVRAAATRLRYLSVRDRATARFLAGVGVEREIAVVPDPTIGLESPPAPTLRAEAGIAPGRPVIGVSVGSAIRDRRAAGFFRALLAALRGLPADLLLFPFGGIYGDDISLEIAAPALPRAVRFPRRPAPLELWSLVGQLDLYVCARFHGMLAAYAQGVPFLVADEYLGDVTATSKVREFIVDRGLEERYLCPYLGERPELKVALAWDGCGDAGPRLRAAAAEDRARLAAHFDALVAALG
jgi:hypothetical protein